MIETLFYRFERRSLEDVLPGLVEKSLARGWWDGEQKPLIPSWSTGWDVRLLDCLLADNYED
jgi:hypothetical protein